MLTKEKRLDINSGSFDKKWNATVKICNEKSIYMLLST